MLRKPTGENGGPSCKGCPLYGNGRGFSALEGDGTSGVMVVAESLGAAEERDGLPLRSYAPSGKVFQQAVDTGGLSRATMTLTNIIRCKAEAPYPPEAIAQCRQYLDAAVAERQPKIIAALGDVALGELIGVAGSISELRGYVLGSRYNIPVVGSYHPSYLARGAFGTLFGVLKHDLAMAHWLARRGVPQARKTSYQLAPTIAAARFYVEFLRNRPELSVAYDTETSEILGIKGGGVVQIQFSHEAGQAVVFPWTHPFDEIAASILALNHTKFDYNGRLFDRPILRQLGVTFGGETHDLMNAYAHLQPGFASSKDDKNGDKGVPSKLLGMQSCVSFYEPWLAPWKHKGMPAWDSGWMGQQLPLPLRLYGARDADYTRRLGGYLFDDLKRAGLWIGYRTYKFELAQVLDDLSARGLPVDRTIQVDLGVWITDQQTTLLNQLQAHIPDELRPLSKKDGYKGFPADLRDAVKAAGLWVKGCKPLEFTELAESLGYVIRPFGSNGDAEPRLVKLLDWNPNSYQQIIDYIKWKGYRVPLHIDTKKESAGKAGIDLLIEETGDEVLQRVEQYKKFTSNDKYAKGDWVPGADGRVHGTFKFGTASGQTSCTNPNVQQFIEHYDAKVEWEAELVRRCKSMIRAEPGHVLIKTDARGAHARMQGWLAEDPAYYRLANFDVHSYNTAHYVGLPDAHELLQLDDAALCKRLKEIKREYEHDRNTKLKRVAYLMQFGGGAHKAFEILSAFSSVLEVEALMEMIRRLYPKSFVEYPAKVQAALWPKLVTPHGAQRWFWDQDVQQAIAFSVSNPFHCHVQSAGIRLYESGAFERYEAVNFGHDSWWWHPRVELADQCIEAARVEMERPSDVLVNSLGAFWCASDAQVGDSLATMRDV